MSDYWKVDDGETQEHWLVLKSVDSDEYRAVVKWDGCIHYESFSGGEVTDDNREYIHYCNLNDEISRLMDLRRQARKHFGKDWE